MQKNSGKRVVVCIIVAIGLVCAGGIGGFFFGRQHQTDSSGVGDNFARERELLARIGEFEQREQIRIEAERSRIAAENSRIERERERIERTAVAIGAIRESDRRSGSLLQELAAEIEILEDFFRGSWSIISNLPDNLGSE